MDMDGVLVEEEHAIPGAARWLELLTERHLPFLVLTNNSMFTPRDLAARLRAIGLEVPEESIWTSALATARFLHEQRPGGSAFVIGEAGLTTAMHEAGYTMTDRTPTMSSWAKHAPTASNASPPPSASSQAVHGSSPRIPTPPGQPPTGRCQRPVPSPRSSPGPPMLRRTTSASPTR